LAETLPPELHYAIPEVKVYLNESVGNSTRIDYGSGHEMAFIMFLYCLFKIGFLNLNDCCAIGLIVFERLVFLTLTD
jgi:serine/threonine-protein phosphatase 2A activator